MLSFSKVLRAKVVRAAPKIASPKPKAKQAPKSNDAALLNGFDMMSGMLHELKDTKKMEHVSSNLFAFKVFKLLKPETKAFLSSKAKITNYELCSAVNPRR